MIVLGADKLKDTAPAKENKEQVKMPAPEAPKTEAKKTKKR